MTDPLLVDRDGARRHAHAQPARLAELARRRAQGGPARGGRRVRADPACRAVVLTGAGRAFCVGQDLREHVESLDGPTTRWRPSPSTTTRWSLALAGLTEPVVAAVRGMAAGAGASLALLADFRIGGPKTAFLMAFANVGLAADTGASWTLPRLVGHAKATELLMLAEPVDAAEAQRLGLLDPPGRRRREGAAGRAGAGRAAGGRSHGGLRPDQARAGRGRDRARWPTPSRWRPRRRTLCGDTADHRNATAAFVAKERPSLRGPVTHRESTEKAPQNSSVSGHAGHRSAARTKIGDSVSPWRPVRSWHTCCAGPRSARGPRRSTPPSGPAPPRRSTRCSPRPAPDAGAARTPAPAPRRPGRRARPQPAPRAAEAAQKQQREQVSALTVWWLDRMVAAEHQAHEKLTFFWHGHWATSVQKVSSRGDARASSRRCTRRAPATSARWRTRWSSDPALIYWLDGQRNTAQAPEREPGPRADGAVHARHRQLHRGRRQGGRPGAHRLGRRPRPGNVSVINEKRHDAGEKTILGRTGELRRRRVRRPPARPAGDAAVRDRPALVPVRLGRARCRRTPTTGWSPRTARAATSRALLRALFTDPAFAGTRGQLVKQPVEWAVGAMRQLGVRPGELTAAEQQQLLRGAARAGPGAAATRRASAAGRPAPPG